MTYASEVLADSPLLFWKLNETAGTTITDSSGNARHGTATASGITYSVDGPFDGDTALEFDGTNGYISRADEAALRLTGAYTLECWVYPTDETIPVNRVNRLIDKLDHAAPSKGYGLAFTSNVNMYEPQTSYLDAGGSDAALAQEAMLLPGRWYHLAFTSDGATGAKFYVDGVLVWTFTMLQPAASTTPFYVGRTHAAGLDPAQRAAARIAGVAVYNTELSAARIAAHYAAGEKATHYGGAFSAATTNRVTTAAGSKVIRAGLRSAPHTDLGSWWKDAAGFDDSAWNSAVQLTVDQFAGFPFQATPPPGAQWITHTDAGGLGSSLLEVHRIHFTLSGPPSVATIKYATDNLAWLVLNGVQLSSYSATFSHHDQFAAAAARNLDPSLFVAGDNVLAVYVLNGSHRVIGGSSDGPMGIALALLMPANRQRSRAYLLASLGTLAAASLAQRTRKAWA